MAHTRGLKHDPSVIRKSYDYLILPRQWQECLKSNAVRPKAGDESLNTQTQGNIVLGSEAETAKDINLINHRLLGDTFVGRVAKL